VSKTSELVTIEQDEMLVLFELLHRWLDDEHGQTIQSSILDDAEIWALNALNTALERSVSEALKGDYRALLEAARDRIRERNGGEWPR
jgi:hypothetical protein